VVRHKLMQEKMKNKGDYTVNFSHLDKIYLSIYYSDLSFLNIYMYSHIYSLG
jgi:hypothetical protein